MRLQLLDYINFCFDELPLEKQEEIALELLTDQNVYGTIVGINKLKEELRTKDKVIAYLDHSARKVEDRFFKAITPERDTFRNQCSLRIRVPDCSAPSEQELFSKMNSSIITSDKFKSPGSKVR